MVSVVWLPDGTYDEARSWQGLLDLIRQGQMSEYTPEQFRKEMQLRAQNWSGMNIRRKSPAETFFRELERIGLVMIIQDQEDNVTEQGL